MRILAGMFAILAIAVSQVAVAQADIQFPEKLDATEYFALHADAGPVYVSGQPSERALEALKREGVVGIINLRTKAETDNREQVPFDEAVRAAGLGLDYVQIPLGEPGSFTPAAVDQFAEALEAAEGKVLVHCASGVRASHMWAAYLVRHKGMLIEDALKYAEAMNLRSEAQVRQLLGEEAS